MRRLLLIVAIVLFLLINQRAMDERQREIEELRSQLGPGRGHVPRAPKKRFRAVDVYRNMLPRGDAHFRDITRFSRGEFDALVEELRPAIVQNRRVRVNVDEPGGQLRPTKLTLQNRVLLTIKFLVFGSQLSDLSNQFGLDDSAVNEELHHGVYAIVETLGYELTWPNAAQRQMLRDIMGPGFANAFGQVDGTFTPSFRRRGDFSGHRHMHLRAHQIATDSLGYIVHVIAGQIGSRHDSFNFQRSQLPELLEASGANLLADIGYAGCEELGLVLPATAFTMPNPAQRRAYNRKHKRWRSRVEQFIGVLKALFATVARRWQRPDRRFLSVCVVACCCLYNRWRRLRSSV